MRRKILYINIGEQEFLIIMNQLGLAITEYCTRFIKNCGKSKLMTEPVHKLRTEGARYLRGLTEDVVQLERNLPKENFSSLERDLIDEIKCGKIENARVIDKNGNLVKGLEFIGDKFSVRLSPECVFKDGVMDKFIDATYIHNHPFIAPLSSNDIYQMAMLKIKKMVACTADGGYSIMERIKPMSEMNYSDLANGAQKLLSEETQKIKQLGRIRGITDSQRMEMLNNWRCERFNSFANEHGLVFRNNINPLNMQGNLEGNLFHVNPLQRLVDNLIIKSRNLSTRRVSQ